ncbi:MAG: hypothetical protein AAF389_04015 [Gemmatimonadota bacterium]
MDPAGGGRGDLIESLSAAAYGAVLWSHSWLRWVVLLLGGATMIELLAPSRRREPKPPSRLHTLFIRLLGLQFLLGAVMYVFLSPLVRAAWSDWSVTMGEPTLRFFAIEHFFGMFLAVGAAHFGWIRLGRDVRWHTAAVIAQALWLVVTVLSIPWPFLAYGRALFRL